MPFQKLPIMARAYILANIAASLFLLVHSFSLGGVQVDSLLAFLLVLSIVTVLPRVHLTVPNGKMTLSNTAIFLAIMLRQDLPEILLVAGISAFFGTVFMKTERKGDGTRAKLTWYKPALSISNLMISAYVATWVWQLAYGDGYPLRENLSIFFLASVVLMSGTYFITNTFGISVAVALAQRLKITEVWKGNFLWTFAGYVCAVSAAAGVAILFETQISVQGFLPFFTFGWAYALLLPPIGIVYYSYKLYLDKIRNELIHIQDLNELNERVISTLAMTIEAKDRYTHKHVERVREYALAIARELGVTGPELEAIRIGSMVHDIGKIAVPEMILTKPGKLTKEEFERMKTHVLVGVKILEAVHFPYPVTDAVAAHHEWWDGNGYPNGLKGDEIPLVGRIVAMADGWDAVTSDRHYRKRMSDEEALEMMLTEKGKHYDPRVVDALVAALPKVKPIIDELNRHEWLADELAGHRRMIPQEALEEIARAAEEAVFLAEVSLKPNVSHSPQDIINLLLEKVTMVVPATAAAVYLLDEETQEVQVKGCCGLFNDLLEGLSMKVGEGVSGWVVKYCQIALNEPAANDLARRLTPGKNLELNSSLSVPLMVGDSCLGTITIYHSGYNLYNAHHQRLLTILADHASNALDTLFRLETNQVLAYTDSLTDLPNMRFLIQHLETLTGKDGNPFSILMLDLNGFKQINDNLGHLEGDRVLKDVARLLRGSTRSDDLVGRYAGDEFVIVCEGGQQRDLDQMVDRIRAAFREYRPLAEAEFTLSASIGCANFPEDGTDWSSLLSLADQRMYSDKLSYHDLHYAGLPEPRRRSEGFPFPVA